MMLSKPTPLLPDSRNAELLDAQSLPYPTPARIRGLDGLRAAAVVWVMISHYCPEKGTMGVLDRMIRSGAFGVEVFFVLSGFLITYLLLNEEVATGSISLKLFYARRALRIVPPLFFYLFVLAALCFVGVVSVTPIDFIASSFFFRNFVGTAVETGHLWTLAIEEQFYLLFPLFLLIVATSSKRVRITFVLCALLPFWSYYILHAAKPASMNYTRTDVRVQPLLIGALLALMVAEPVSRRLLRGPCAQGTWISCAAVAFLLLAQTTNLLNVPVFRLFVPSGCGLSIAVIINTLLHNQRAAYVAVLELPAVAWLGRLSYSLYLWQQLFAAHILHIKPTWFRVFPINVLFAVGCAVFSYYILERPLMSLRKYLRHH